MMLICGRLMDPRPKNPVNNLILHFCLMPVQFIYNNNNDISPIGN